jgi:hypothetical protein
MFHVTSIEVYAQNTRAHGTLLMHNIWLSALLADILRILTKFNGLLVGDILLRPESDTL